MFRRARAATWLLAATALVAVAGSVRAQTPIEGFGPDLQVSGGIGLGVGGGKLDNSFLGRLRLGALYAFEPYWIDIGVIAEVGALSGLAIGGEFEWNEFHGWFANAGLAYAKHERLTGHLSCGYLIFGLEWQHAFATRRPSDALLFTVRFPLGFWWFTSGREARPFAPPPSAPPATRSGALVVRTARPRGPQQPSAAVADGAAATATPDSERQRLATRALGEAALAGAQGDLAAVSDALRRAYAAEADPLLWLRIADADLARGQLALAAEDLQRFLGSASSPVALAQKPAVEARLRELLPRLARLRLSLDAALGGEGVELDGVEQPGALLGYDVLLDPGSHVLRVRRTGQEPLEHRFEAQAGELVRLTLPQ